MIVPSFWAEARRQTRRGKRQITVRRWGWSDTSEADAQAMADARADEALALAQTDNTVERRERKVAYNGAQGVPIREEVLERLGDTVITRNAYGARCLNTPDVLFADVDFDTALPRALYVVALCLLAAGVLLPARWLLGSWGWLAFGLVVVLGTAAEPGTPGRSAGSRNGACAGVCTSKPRLGSACVPHARRPTAAGHPRARRAGQRTGTSLLQRRRGRPAVRAHVRKPALLSRPADGQTVAHWH
jgi:hypothetical protein